MVAAPPSAHDREAIARLRELFRDAGFDAGRIQDSLGTSGELLASSTELPVYLRRLDQDAFGTLVRLFLLEAPAGRSAVETALSAPAVGELLEAGILEAADGGVRAAVRIVPHDDLFIASDRRDRAVGAQFVSGVYPPSATLANLTVRRPVATALDLCTGCGIQAILASRHAEHVVATDVSERALGFAAFNAELNGVENIELRHGNFLEPVAGERFDLVVCNPPYVVSPETDVLFRDSGLPRDAVSELLVGGVPGLLTDGGLATVMASWIQDGDDPSTRPFSWLEGSACDALLVHSGTEDPLSAAALWNRDAAPDSDRYAELLDRWLAYFAEEEIAAIAYGAFVLRRRAEGRPWSATIPLPRRPEPASAHLERILAGRDVLEAVDGNLALLDRRVVLAPTVVFEHRLRPVEGRLVAGGASVRLDEGLGYSAGLDEAAAALVVRLDGKRALRDVLADVQHDAGLDDESLVDSGVGLARMLLELGFAVVVEDEI
jgi:methylase of polypeptide subunit release factors